MSRRVLVAVVGAVMIALGGCGASSAAGPDIVSALPDPQEQGWETWDIWFADYAALGIESFDDIHELGPDGTTIPVLWRRQANDPAFADHVGWDESDIEQFAAVTAMGGEGLLVLRGPTRDDVLQGELLADVDSEQVGDHDVWEVAIPEDGPSMMWGGDTDWVAFPADDLVLWSSDRDLLESALALQDGDGTALAADPVVADTLSALSTDAAMLLVTKFETRDDDPVMFGSSATSTDGVAFARAYASEEDAQAALEDVDALVADPSGSIVQDVDDITTGVDGHAVHLTGTTTRAGLWRQPLALMDPIIGFSTS